MAKMRFSALEEVLHRNLPSRPDRERGADVFGCDVLTLPKLREYLSAAGYKRLEKSLEEGLSIDHNLADQVASGMKSWAVSRGATHYTHWFHPLNGVTAEKHDSFMDVLPDGTVMEQFDGRALIQQESDASGFPSGGIRNTFEARGYTAWDPTSPAFINNKTLCIPTIFVAYTGDALDYKTPLMKSLAFIDRAAVDVCQFFDKDVSKVVAELGWEQEFFLADEALFDARPDLLMCGRTLLGHVSAKDQLHDEYYFGAIPERVAQFLEDLEYACARLGIPVKTKHNERAPHQFELASLYEEAGLSVDHNQLLMSTMKRIAKQHKFCVLMHEKPYRGVSGSGKHCNWSLKTNTGVNIMAPGKNPKSNIQFLVFTMCTVMAVYRHQRLLQAGMVSLGNHERFEDCEAPAYVMSVFLGEQLETMFCELEKKVSDKRMSPDEKTELKLNVCKVPEILLDNTDRNRTSPVAFTGNRFELRGVGSSANCAGIMILFNAAVAEQLVDFKNGVDRLIDSGVKKDEAIFQILRKYIIESKKIRFNGNCKSPEWFEEAKRRGLSLETAPDEMLKGLITPESKALLINNGIISESELAARYEVRHEIILKNLQIESRVVGGMAMNHIVPAAIEYQNKLIANVKGLKEIFAGDDSAVPEKELTVIRDISECVSEIIRLTAEMSETRTKVDSDFHDIVGRSAEYVRTVYPYMDKIRSYADHLEMLVDNELWPLPKYRELLFL